jgi:hypothetical protein
MSLLDTTYSKVSISWDNGGGGGGGGKVMDNPKPELKQKQ